MSDTKSTDSLTSDATESALNYALKRGAEYADSEMTVKSHNIRDLLAVRRELQAEEAASRGNLLTRGINPIPRRG